MIAEAAGALFKGLMEKVASGELTPDQASEEFESKVLEADMRISDNQSKINLAESQSEHWLQWGWRPAACAGLTVAVLVWPFCSMFDAFGWIALTQEQMDNLRNVSVMMSPYWAGAMGLREYGKYRRQEGLISKIAGLVKK